MAVLAIPLAVTSVSAPPGWHCFVQRAEAQQPCMEHELPHGFLELLSERMEPHAERDDDEEFSYLSSNHQ